VPDQERHTMSNLIDADTNEVIGEATAEQIAASSETVEGIILVDADGDVVTAGEFGAAGARRVYVDAV